MSIWIPVLSLAFVSIMNLLRGKLTYCAFEKKTNEPAHGKLLLITKINNEDLSETVHLCLLISVIEYACDSTHTLRPAKPFQSINLSKRYCYMMIGHRYMTKKLLIVILSSDTTTKEMESKSMNRKNL